jgi:XapX domain-containing protein
LLSALFGAILSSGEVEARVGQAVACLLRGPASRLQGELRMKMYAISLAMGVLVGLIYGATGVRSPAPPLVALVGLLGMLGGEALLPIAKSFWGTADKPQQHAKADNPPVSGRADHSDTP